MTRIISILSGKGGTGKTTLTANLGVCFSEFGKNTFIIDANVTTPNLGLHLGVPIYPVTLHDVLKGRANIRGAVYTHESGLKVVPAGISIDDLKGIDARDLPNAVLDLLGQADIILIDGAAGLGREALAAIESSDEILIVTNPELPSVADALKTAKLAERMGARVLGVVVNRKTGKKHELTKEKIIQLLGDIYLLAEIPEHDHIKESIAYSTPVVYHKPYSYVSKIIRKVAADIIGKSYDISIPWYKKLFRFI